MPFTKMCLFERWNTDLHRQSRLSWISCTIASMQAVSIEHNSIWNCKRWGSQVGIIVFGEHYSNSPLLARTQLHLLRHAKL